LGVGCAYAKKQPKYEQARLLTPEQAALVRRSIAQEKVLIKDIKMRTPLVETYIQDTRPDDKLLRSAVDDQYILSRVDFGKTSSTGACAAERGRQEGVLQGVSWGGHWTDQAAGA